MTFAHYKLGWEYAGTAPHKILLLALADHADKDGFGWPGIARLASMTGLHRSTVMRTLLNLERNGAITCTRRRGRSTRYQLVVERDASQSATGSTGRLHQSRSATGPVAKGDSTSRTQRPEPITEASKEPTNESMTPLTFEDVD